LQSALLGKQAFSSQLFSHLDAQSASDARYIARRSGK
jgi:hypothetical protein